jgi:signal transduction histidine kinase
MLDVSLSRALGYDETSRPSVGIGQDASSDPSIEGESETGHMVVFWVDVDSEGALLHSNGASVTISTSSLETVLSEALTAEDDTGSVDSLHLSWRRAETTTGWRVAIADTSGIDSTLRSMALQDLVIISLSMLALFGITWYLSKWALGPVEKSWDQQRRFVADASHELKTPLSVILANSQILEEHAGDLPSDDQRWLKSTQDEAERMKGLVNDLLELARTDENTLGDKGAFQAIDIDLSSLVENVALEFDAVAFERGCEIESDVDEGIHVTGDPAEIGRLVKTLTENACKYAAANSTVMMTLHRDGAHARLVVNNQGSPIDPEDLPHVFDRFYRSDKSRTRETGEETGGYGLGLAIAKGIAEAHKGTITCTSTEDAGTSFIVTL